MKYAKLKVGALIVGLLVLDQAVKIAVKTHMTLDESIRVLGHWFYIRFIENPGAAYGFEFGGEYGKLALSVLRIAAVVFLAWYINRLIDRRVRTGVVMGFSLILVGALGNIVDSAFYGLIFSASTPVTVARFVPWGEGYASFLHGNVVDMFYFPIVRGTFPAWFPFYGGEPFVFFSPVFNLADTYISVGVIYMLLFQRKFFK